MGFGKDGMGVILRESLTIALGTLGADTGILATGGIGTGLLERFRIIKTEITAHISGPVFALGDGPLELYLADGDFSLAEIEASVEATGPLGPNDKVNEALVERYTKLFGAMAFAPNDSGIGNILEQGRIVSKTLRWTFARTKGWNWMFYNRGTPLTTGATAKVRAKHFGVWVA